MAAVDDEPDAAVLGQALLGDVQLGHDLHARDDARGHPPRHGRDVLQHAVDAEADAQLAAVGREVDVGGAALDRLRDDLVDELDDGRVVGGLVQRDDLAPSSSSSSAARSDSPTTSSRRSRREISAAMSSGGATATRTS